MPSMMTDIMYNGNGMDIIERVKVSIIFLEEIVKSNNKNNNDNIIPHSISLNKPNVQEEQ